MLPLSQMGLPHTNAFAINIPVASRNNDETFAQQLFDDLIDKALTHDFNNRKCCHKMMFMVVLERRSGFLREEDPSVRAKNIEYPRVIRKYSI